MSDELLAALDALSKKQGYLLPTPQCEVCETAGTAWLCMECVYYMGNYDGCHGLPWQRACISFRRGEPMTCTYQKDERPFEAESNEDLPF